MISSTITSSNEGGGGGVVDESDSKLGVVANGSSSSNNKIGVVVNDCSSSSSIKIGVDNDRMGSSSNKNVTGAKSGGGGGNSVIGGGKSVVGGVDSVVGGNSVVGGGDSGRLCVVGGVNSGGNSGVNSGRSSGRSSCMGNAETPPEDFKDASNEFFNPASWDALMGKGAQSQFKESSLARESLYAKFDPLVAKELDKQSATTKLLSNNSNNDLLSFSPASSKSDGLTDTTINEFKESNQSPSLRYSSGDLLRMQKEWDLKFKTRMLSREREWGAKEEEVKMNFARKCKEHEMERNKLQEKSNYLQSNLDNMKLFIGEYEKTIKKLIDDKDKTSSLSKESQLDLVRDRDQALEDLQNVETAFSDLHRRYEKSKAATDVYRKNEVVLKRCVLDLQDKARVMDEKYKSLKGMMEEKMSAANEEIDKVRKTSQSNIAILQVAVRKAEMQAQSLESTVEQKTRENKELTVICDELIARAKL